MAAGASHRRRFTVAFSHAGEDRSRVEPLAEALAQRLGRQQVLYDRFHEAEFARPGLDVYLPRLYRDESELIVVVLSPDYPRKAWCGLELRWIRQLLLGPGSERIMLLSLGDPQDLSSLGLGPGDGYLEVSRRSAAEVVERILERLALQGVGVDAAPKATGELDGSGGGGVTKQAGEGPWRWPWPRRRATLLAAGLVAAAAVALPLAWRVAGEQQARRQRQNSQRQAQALLAAGDQAFGRFDKAFEPTEQDRQLTLAEAAWLEATRLDPTLVAPLARLAFVHDLRGELPAAEAAWHQAIEREPPETPAAQGYRIGLAGVLAQLPGRAQEAIKQYEADRDHPRAAVELAMLRWGEPASLPRARDAVNSPELAASLAGGAGPSPGWSFPLPGRGELLVFNRRHEQRCVLAAVRATTDHLLGSASGDADPLVIADCQGRQVDVRDLLCRRLPPAATLPRAAGTSRWLRCPPPGSTSGQPQAIS